MNRWITRSLGALKRGVISLLVCAVVLLPLLLAIVQWGHLFNFSNDDGREVVATQPLNVRPIDRTPDPIKPFDQPLITVTFDDGWETIYTSGLPLLQKHGIPTTQYVLTGVFDDKKYLSLEQIKSMQRAGHEIACHGIDHANLTMLTDAMVQKQLQDCRTYFESQLGVRVDHFASPYGSSNPKTIAAIQGLYQSHRNTNGDIMNNGVDDQDVNIRGSFDRYNIHAITIRRDTTVEQLQQAIDYTVRNNGWLVLNYHDVNDSDTAYGVDHAALDRQLAAISRADARIVTVGEVINALNMRPQ